MQGRGACSPETCSPSLTVAEDGEAQEGQVALPLDGVPAQVWVTLGNKHGATLKTTACQVHHHLHTHAHARTHTQSDWLARTEYLWEFNGPLFPLTQSGAATDTSAEPASVTRPENAIHHPL